MTVETPSVLALRRIVLVRWGPVADAAVGQAKAGQPLSARSTLYRVAVRRLRASAINGKEKIQILAYTAEQ